MTPTSGFLLLDKPAGITSHDAVDRIRRILGCAGRKARSACRVGHAGTLDPFATGLLIIGIGKATKQLQEIVGLDKTYEAVARLGATSTTDDLEGEIAEMAIGNRLTSNGRSNASLTESPLDSARGRLQPRVESRLIPTLSDLERTIDSFRGAYAQTAPAFSAKKVGGNKLYELARKGKIDTVERPIKEVTIHELVMTKYEWPDLAFRVSCSSGTYVRALARDIGEKLGCGAYLTALRRTSIGPYRVDNAVRLEGLDNNTVNEKMIGPS